MALQGLARKQGTPDLGSVSYDCKGQIVLHQAHMLDAGQFDLNFVSISCAASSIYQCPKGMIPKQVCS
jgi:hypothetical protein